MPAIAVTPTLSIDDSELAFAFARASGPGGQNVNKVESAVHLRFDVANSPSLDDGTKRRLATMAGRASPLRACWCCSRSSTAARSATAPTRRPVSSR